MKRPTPMVGSEEKNAVVDDNLPVTINVDVKDQQNEIDERGHRHWQERRLQQEWLQRFWKESDFLFRMLVAQAPGTLHGRSRFLFKCRNFRDVDDQPLTIYM